MVVPRNSCMFPLSPQSFFPELEVMPSVVNATVFKPFQIECISHRLGVRPVVVFSSGANVSLDGQFQILTPDRQRVIVSVPRGLPVVYNGMTIQSVT